MVSLNWTELAFADLKNIFEFISKDSKYYAFIHIKKIKEKTNLIKCNPKIGRVVPELQKEDIREIIYGNYRIIYQIKNEKRIDILSIYHSSRILNISN